jgi:CheY-like chemotaxis protein
LLSEDLENTEHADRIAKIKRAADRCARIVQSFLAMARQKAPEYRSVDINDQVRAAVELTEYQMRAANVALKLHVAGDLPLIKADPDQLHQVIVNLLTNARQALEDNEGERVIAITSSLRENRIRLAVADNGKGIDAVTRDRLFDPFFTTKAPGKSTGIGLSYSLGIIQAHGGTITIEDAAEDADAFAGVGTVFVITLPIETSAEKSAATGSAMSAKAKGRALIIDDEEDVAETLADMLERMGMSTTMAVGGVAGQDAMADGAAFDLVLSDIRMPDCDGPTLYTWITANRPDLASRVAFVTGDTLSGIAADFLEQTRCPVLEKPFTPAGLRDLVAAMLPN